MEAVVPAYAKGGDTVSVMLPGNQLCNVIIPAGLMPGDKFRFNPPPPTNGGVRAAYQQQQPSHPTQQAPVQQQRSQPTQRGQELFSVQIPKNVVPGGSFFANLPDGRGMVSVICPADRRAGDTIQIQISQPQQEDDGPKQPPPPKKKPDPKVAQQVYEIAVEMRDLLEEAMYLNNQTCTGLCCRLFGCLLYCVYLMPLFYLSILIVVPLWFVTSRCLWRFAMGTRQKFIELISICVFNVRAPYLRQIRRDVRVLRKRVDEFTSQQNRAQYAYVIPHDTFLSLNGFVKFEEALQRNLIKKVNVKKDLKTFGTIANCLFVSHKWFGSNPDTSLNAIFNQVKQHVDDRGLNYLFIDYIWFDYMCVPQKDYVAQQQMLLAIPYIMQRCTVKPFFLDEKHLSQYLSSVWCQLEYIAEQGMNKVKGRREGWTIYDVSDLYYVLPGFISMVTSPSFIFNFIGADEQTLILLDILDLFIQYHESHVAENAELKDVELGSPAETSGSPAETAPVANNSEKSVVPANVDVGAQVKTPPVANNSDKQIVPANIDEDVIDRVI